SLQLSFLADYSILIPKLDRTLAPRIDGLRVGDRVSVKGEYEWNDRGGLIHWTHHDPRNVHEGGWIDHNGLRYQ
ncbi:MAG: DUF3465 domain-containing protein, partial [Cyanobacteria bacterium J06588_5]